jgi:hypothetical protein
VITDTTTRRGRPALTSDRSHVVHASWTGNLSGKPRFERSIVSEHSDRDGAVQDGRALIDRIANQLRTRPVERRDQVFVRQPKYRSLLECRRFVRRRVNGPRSC